MARVSYSQYGMYSTCQEQYKLNYICLMPTNLYGPNDNYDLKTSHFYPALISKIYKAKKNNKKDLIIWGNGKPKRELMYVDDLASACEFFLKKKSKTRNLPLQLGDIKKNSCKH